MLKKIITVDRIEIVLNGCVQVRVKTAILEDDKELSSVYRRYFIAPGDDYSAEDPRVKAVCAAVHTLEVIEAYKA